MNGPSKSSLKPLSYQRELPGSAAASDLYFPDKVCDLVVPTALLLAGFVIATWIYVRFGRAGVKPALVALSCYMVFRAFVLLVTIPLLTQLAGLSFGIWAPAILKLAAVSIFPESLALLCLVFAGPCYGLLVGLIVGFVTSSLLFMKLFELEWGEARLCVAVTWTVALLFHGGWWWLSDLIFGLIF